MFRERENTRVAQRTQARLQGTPNASVAKMPGLALNLDLEAELDCKRWRTSYHTRYATKDGRSRSRWYSRGPAAFSNTTNLA
jgi:hypothetical protein